MDQITGKLGDLSRQEIQKLRRYEEGHRGRKTLLEQLGRVLEEK